MRGSLTVFGIRDDHGRLLYTTGLIKDITLRKEAEDRIKRHNEELERLVAERTAQIQKLEQLRLKSEKQVAVGRMAARIAHEINNPLAGIKNSFLLVKRAIPTDHKHYEFVGRIEKEIERVARIVRQMFELYKPERREPSMLRPDEVIREVADLLTGNLRSQGVNLEIDTIAAQRHGPPARRFAPANPLQRHSERHRSDAHGRFDPHYRRRRRTQPALRCRRSGSGHFRRPALENLRTLLYH